MKTEFQPLADHILVQRIEAADKTKGGIFIPDTAKEKPTEAKVIATGPGRWADGAFRETQVKKGDRVLFGKYNGTEVKLDDEDYLIIREEDILGVISK
jgi:chaperonin GroES